MDLGKIFMVASNSTFLRSGDSGTPFLTPSLALTNPTEPFFLSSLCELSNNTDIVNVDLNPV